MGYFLIRWVILIIAIGVTAHIMPGLHIEGGLFNLAIIAIIFALVNAIIRPIVSFLTCPLIIFTLGLFILVINTLMLQITAWLSPALSVDGFWPAFWASLVISIVSGVLNISVAKKPGVIED